MMQHEKEVFEESDLILPDLVLPDPCNVRVAIYAGHITLCVGPRDWSWDRETGELLGAGMDVTKNASDNSNERSSRKADRKSRSLQRDVPRDSALRSRGRS
jgi:hypothetical protein